MNDTTLQARQKALQALEEFQSVATSLISYQSNGRVIVFGHEDDLIRCKTFSKPLTTTLVLMEGSPPKLSEDDVICLGKMKIEIQGYLGKFVVNLVTDSKDPAIRIEADVIVDLNEKPIVKQAILPPGYLHEDVSTLDHKVLESQLLDLVGEFEKPKYFKYNESICAHGTNGKTVCTNCIDACPAGAISSLVEKIEVDPYLCQGGGTCATVCPSGAIQYVYPRLADSGNKVRKMLQAFAEHGGENAIVVFHSGEDFPQSLFTQYPKILPVVVEELASVGMDLCLSALVYGASQVVLLSNESVPQLSLENLNQQVDWLQSMLTGLNLNPLRVTIIENYADFSSIETPWQLKPALYTMPDNKRAAIFQGIDHLYQQIEKTREMVALPAGAPFGEAMIDEKSCTLCMACISACPGNALQDGSNREVPEVFFIESNCIQCGTCTQTCPEQAISISPRIIFDREKRNKSRVLNQDSPYACISCGKEFAPTSVIQLMSHKLKDHYMFKTPRALDRLKMCDDCRVADIVQDPDALNRHLDPLN